MTATFIKNGALVSGAATVTFSARFGYVEFENRAATPTDGMWVTTDGVTSPTANGDDCFYVGAGERAILPNRAPMWWQGFGGPAGKTNPGTTIMVAGTGTDAFTVTGR